MVRAAVRTINIAGLGASDHAAPMRIGGSDAQRRAACGMRARIARLAPRRYAVRVGSLPPFARRAARRGQARAARARVCSMRSERPSLMDAHRVDVAVIVKHALAHRGIQRRPARGGPSITGLLLPPYCLCRAAADPVLLRRAPVALTALPAESGQRGSCQPRASPRMSRPVGAGCERGREARGFWRAHGRRRRYWQ